MRISELSRQLERWRHDAKGRHGLTDRELAKLLGCSPSRLTHGNLYRMPFYQAMRLKELADE